MWKEHAGTLPFLYVEKYHSEAVWHFDPLFQDFVAVVEAVAGDRDARIRYFEQCKWAVHQFSSSLNPIARRSVVFPLLPQEISSHECKPPYLTGKVIAAARTAPPVVDIDSLTAAIERFESIGEAKIEAFRQAQRFRK